MSRLRSESKHFSRMVISCNPDPSHEIKDMISFYLDEDGYPDPNKDGIVRYFIQRDGEYHWGETRQELAERFGIPEKDWEHKILSFSFVSATIYDNPPMIENNGSYLAFLEGLNEVDKAQLLHGCWAEFAFGNKYFNRDWLDKVDRVPYGDVSVRGYDFGASERSMTNKSPDPTTCIKMYKSSDGYYTITGEYHEDFYDDVDDIQGAIYQLSGTRDHIMLKQAHYDGKETIICAPQDPAAAGKTLFAQQAAFFAGEGFIFKKDPCPINKNKLTKFLPFATACENKLVRIVESTFSPKTLNYIYKQLEIFDGEKSSNKKRDDFADCMASCFNLLNTVNVTKAVVLPMTANATKLSQYRKSLR